MQFNLHTHTFRCNHAVGEDREYVEAAIKSGFKTLGFSDHTPQFFKKERYYSYFRMKPELTEDYVKSVLSLKKEYQDDINILLGFEVEYYPECYDRLREFLAQFEPDYLILGQHFIANEYDEGEYYVNDKNRGDLILKHYVSQAIAGLSTGDFTYIAHPDIKSNGGDPDIYRSEMLRLCSYARDNNIPLEYNILGYKYSKGYPKPDFWHIVKESGAKALLGIDAHDPAIVKDIDLHSECRSKLAGIGITPLEFDEVTIRKPFAN